MTQYATGKRINKLVGKKIENLEIDSLNITKSFMDVSLVAKGLV